MTVGLDETRLGELSRFDSCNGLEDVAAQFCPVLCQDLNAAFV